MIRPPKSRINKINRHSSQLIMRRISNERPFSPKENDELNNKRNSFWMKKTVFSQGVENSAPNQDKKPSSARSRKGLMIKTKTNGSEDCASELHKHEGDPTDINSKLLLLEKYQGDVAEEVRLIGLQKLPRLPQCESLFKSLNRVLKTIIKTPLKEAFPALERIIRSHIESSEQIFTSLKNYSTDFVSLNKCEDLIGRNIRLEKENLALLNKAIADEALIKSLKSECKQSFEEFESTQNFSLNKISFEKIFIANSINFPQIIASKKSIPTALVCDKIITAIVKENRSGDSLKFFVESQCVNEFLNCKESFSVFRKLIQNKNTDNLQSFSERVIYEILNHTFNHEVFGKVMQMMSGHFERGEGKINKFLLLHRKFQVIGNEEKVRQILIELCCKMRDSSGLFLPQSHKEEINTMVSNMTNVKPIQSSRAALQDRTNNHELVGKMKSKRLLNCLSLFNGNKKGPRHKNISTMELEDDEEEMESHKFFKDSILDWKQMVMFYYYFVSQQAEFLEKSLSVFLRIDPSKDIEKHLESMMVGEKVELLERKGLHREIRSVEELSCHLMRMEGYSREATEQAKDAVSAQIRNLLMGKILE